MPFNIVQKRSFKNVVKALFIDPNKTWKKKFAGSGAVQIARSIRRANSIHAPSPTTNFLASECEDGDENQVGMALGPTEEQVGILFIVDCVRITLWSETRQVLLAAES